VTKQEKVQVAEQISRLESGTCGSDRSVAIGRTPGEFVVHIDATAPSGDRVEEERAVYGLERHSAEWRVSAQRGPWPDDTRDFRPRTELSPHQ